MCLKLGFTEKKCLNVFNHFLSELESDFNVLSDESSLSLWIIYGTRCEVVKENNSSCTDWYCKDYFPKTNKADSVIDYSRAATPAVISEISAVIFA